MRSNVEITVLDGDGDENKAPLRIENESYLDYQEDQEEVHPKQGSKRIVKQPIKYIIGSLIIRTHQNSDKILICVGHDGLDEAP